MIEKIIIIYLYELSNLFIDMVKLSYWYINKIPNFSHQPKKSLHFISAPIQSMKCYINCYIVFMQYNKIFFVISLENIYIYSIRPMMAYYADVQFSIKSQKYKKHLLFSTFLSLKSV